MKATGIVRRIEECGIIGQKSKKPHKHWVFADFCPMQFAQNPFKNGFSIKKARCILHIMMPDERYVHPAFYFLNRISFVPKVI